VGMGRRGRDRLQLLKAAVRTAPTSRPEEALLDAAERLLVDVGYAGVSTRRLAAEAGVNHGLVHYYYGSVENLLLQVLERFTGRMIERQRTMYSADTPFLEKWRTAMRYLVTDTDYQKVWWELQALSWNRPGLRERVANVDADWRAVLTEAFAEPHERYGLEIPLDALVSLVITFNSGIILERLAGIATGHQELLEWIDSWIERKEKEQWRRRKN
jgi:AcrR family transcriptional regulator